MQHFPFRLFNFCLTISIILISESIWSQTKLDSLFELQKDCEKVENVYELIVTENKSNYEIKNSISEDGLLVLYLENYSSDTLELKNDCGFFHLIVEVNINDSISIYNTWCDHVQFRKYQLLPGNGMTSCYGIIDENWVNHRLRIGITANNKELFTDWMTVK